MLEASPDMEHEPPILVYSANESDRGDGTFDPAEFFRARKASLYSTTCPYCQRPCQTESASMQFSGAMGWQEDACAWCTTCGWWSFQADQDDLSGQAYFLSARAILKRFVASSEEVPLDPLKSYLFAHPERLGAVHPKKFEELVADVYSELFGYRVEHCSYGRPDLGVDVVVLNIENGSTIAIQVKRYKHPIELGLIHQFFGAMFDGAFRNGVFVTSGLFRSGAVRTAARLSSRWGVSIDLIDGRKFLDFVGVLNTSRSPVSAGVCPYWKSTGYMRTPGGPVHETLGGSF